MSIITGDDNMSVFLQFTGCCMAHVEAGMLTGNLGEGMNALVNLGHALNLGGSSVRQSDDWVIGINVNYGNGSIRVSDRLDHCGRGILSNLKKVMVLE